MRPGPPQRAAAYQQPAWASPTWKVAARVESLSSAGAACTIITKQISTLTAGTGAAHPRRRCDGCTGRRGRQGAHPRARKTEVTRARYPPPEPRRTSPPLTDQRLFSAPMIRNEGAHEDVRSTLIQRTHDQK